MTGATLAGTHSQLRAFLRNPLHLAALALVPLVTIAGFGEAMSSFPSLPGMTAVPETLGQTLGALFSVSFLAGILGTFQSLQARETDRRLVLTGFGPLTLLAIRLLTILAVTLVVVGWSYLILRYNARPVAPGYAVGALLLGGLIYALLGILVGAVVSGEFEASLVVIFVANMDAFLGSGIVSVDGAVSRLLPLYFPGSILRAAVTDGAVASADLAGSALVVGLLSTLVAVLYGRSLGLDR